MADLEALGVSAELQAAVARGEAEEARLEYLPLDLVDVAENVRVDPGDLDDLVASIRELGVLQPIRAIGPGPDGHYRAVWGQRRILASRLAERATIPALVEPVADVDTPGARRSIEQLSENLIRKDLSPIEEGEALKAVLDADPSLTRVALAEQLGRSESWLSNAMRLLNLEASVRTEVAAGRISASHAKVMVALPAERQRRLAERIVNDKLSAHQVENEIRWAQTEADNEEAKRKRTERFLPKVVPALEAAKVAKDAPLYVRGQYGIDDKPVRAAIRKAGWKGITDTYLWDAPAKGKCDCVAFILDLGGRAPTVKRACVDDRHRDWARNAERLEDEAARAVVDGKVGLLQDALEREFRAMATPSPVIKLLWQAARSYSWGPEPDDLIAALAKEVAHRHGVRERIDEILAELDIVAPVPEPKTGLVWLALRKSPNGGYTPAHLFPPEMRVEYPKRVERSAACGFDPFDAANGYFDMRVDPATSPLKAVQKRCAKCQKAEAAS